jgi:hypothetical protein
LHNHQTSQQTWQINKTNISEAADSTSKADQAGSTIQNSTQHQTDTADSIKKIQRAVQISDTKRQYKVDKVRRKNRADSGAQAGVTANSKRFDV